MNLFTIYGARACRMFFIENFRVLLGFFDLGYFMFRLGGSQIS